MILQDKKIWVAGHNGMVGRAIVRSLELNRCKILTVPKTEVDLTNQLQVASWMESNKPEVVIIAAAKVGGILANTKYPAEFIHNNIAIQINIIHQSYLNKVEKLLFLGSSCIYPKHAPQPIPEEALLTGPLEPTNEWYAIAKIAGIKMCQAYRKQYGCDFISAQPTNLYGPYDTFDVEDSHVIPAIMLKMHQAKINKESTVKLFGSGNAKREFLHVYDLANALLFLLEKYSDDAAINVGSGHECTIKELANMIANIVGYRGTILFDQNMPDGTPRKLVDSSKIRNLQWNGWKPVISLEGGLKNTYEWFIQRGTV